MRSVSTQSISSLRLLLAFTHLTMSFISAIRPNQIELIPGYAKFGQIATTGQWGMAMLVISLGLFFLPRASFVLIVWQTASASMFFLFFLLVTSGPTGVSWGSAVYFCLFLASGFISYISADQLFQRTGAPQKLRDRLGQRNGR